MLLRKIAKTAFDALPDVMKAEYKPNPTNAEEYLLDAEEAREAIAARDREKLRADNLQTQIEAINTELKAAKDAREAAESEAATKKGDIPAIEASWKKKLDDAIAAAQAVQDKLTNQLKNLLVRQQAEKIANAISTVPDLLVDKIAARLEANLDGETPSTRVLGADGKPTANTLDELQKEFVANAAYATIIKSNDASGGGADGGPSGGGAPSGKKFSELTEQQKVALSRTNPAEYKRLVEAHRAALKTK